MPTSALRRLPERGRALRRLRAEIADRGRCAEASFLEKPCHLSHSDPNTPPPPTSLWKTLGRGLRRAAKKPRSWERGFNFFDYGHGNLAVVIPLTAERTRSHCRDVALNSPLFVSMPHYPLRVIIRPYLNAGASPAALKLPIFLGLHNFTSRGLALVPITNHRQATQYQRRIPQLRASIDCPLVE